MKHMFKKWLSNIRKIMGGQQIKQTAISGLTIYRFSTPNELKRLKRNIKKDSLCFITYADAHYTYWLRIFGQDYGMPDLVETKAHGIALIAESGFLSGRDKKLIDIAKQSMNLSIPPQPISSTQYAQWLWLINKIENAADSDYIFRADYMKELLLQVIHFSLKHCLLNKCAEPEYHEIMIYANDRQVLHNYAELFEDEANYISAN